MRFGGREGEQTRGLKARTANSETEEGVERAAWPSPGLLSLPSYHHLNQ